MSARVLAKAHIDTLVQGLVQEGIIAFADRDRSGQALWDENRRSVNHRYTSSEPFSSYTADGIEAPLADGMVVAATICYRYQACEDPEWERSDAHRRTGQLLRAVLVRHTEHFAGDSIDHAAGRFFHGYITERFGGWPSREPMQAGVWGITSMEQAIDTEVGWHPR